MTSRISVPEYTATYDTLNASARANLVSCVHQARSRAYAALASRFVREQVLRLVHADITETLMAKAALHLIEAPQYCEQRSRLARETFLSSYLTACLLSWLAENVSPEDRHSVTGTADALLTR